VDELRWSLHPDALLVMAALAGVYAVGVRGEAVPRWRLACFGGGLVLVLIAHVTPLASLATSSLLSAHLFQNVLLAEWAPALVVLGIPAGLAARLGTLPGARLVTHPAVALPLWIATYVAWHVPAAYDLALRHQSTALHLEHASYFVTGVLLWWPVFQDVPHRLSSASKAVYLLAAFMLSSPIGIVLSLLSRPVYAFYVAAPDIWGLSDLADQQIAGVTMSVEEAALFFCLGAYFVVRFLREEEARELLREHSSQIA
jgi:cytochrome c oxidase assembly factor CtaG